jgi:AP-3 complex subunit sigma
MAIHAVLIINNVGKPRLAKFYAPSPPHARAAAVSRIYDLISARPDSVCNFIDAEGGLAQLTGATGKGKARATAADDATTSTGEGKPLRICYRRFATLYFVFVIDENESELGILDLIQVRPRPVAASRAGIQGDSVRRSSSSPWTAASPKSASWISSLPLTGYMYRLQLCHPLTRGQVHTLLNCIIVGGYVMDTNVDSIAMQFKAAEKEAKKSQNAGGLGGEISLASAAQGWDRLGFGALRGRA